jgi:hypothetical protein
VAVAARDGAVVSPGARARSDRRLRDVGQLIECRLARTLPVGERAPAPAIWDGAGTVDPWVVVRRGTEA